MKDLIAGENILVFSIGLIGGALFMPMESSKVNRTNPAVLLLQHEPIHGKVPTAAPVESVPTPERIAFLGSVPDDAWRWLQLTEAQIHAINSATSNMVSRLWELWASQISKETTDANGFYSATLKPIDEHGQVLREDYLRSLRDIVGGEKYWVLWDHLRDHVHDRTGHFGKAERQLIIARRPHVCEWRATDTIRGRISSCQYAADHLPDELRTILNRYMENEGSQ